MIQRHHCGYNSTCCTSHWVFHSALIDQDRGEGGGSETDESSALCVRWRRSPPSLPLSCLASLHVGLAEKKRPFPFPSASACSPGGDQSSSSPLPLPPIPSLPLPHSHSVSRASPLPPLQSEFLPNIPLSVPLFSDHPHLYPLPLPPFLLPRPLWDKAQDSPTMSKYRQHSF